METRFGIVNLPGMLFSAKWWLLCLPMRLNSNSSWDVVLEVQHHHGLCVTLTATATAMMMMMRIRTRRLLVATDFKGNHNDRENNEYTQDQVTVEGHESYTMERRSTYERSRHKSTSSYEQLAL